MYKIYIQFISNSRYLTFALVHLNENVNTFTPNLNLISLQILLTIINRNKGAMFFF